MLARMLAGLAPSLQVLLPRLGLRALRSSAAIARRKAHRLGVERLDAGPEAIAATFREGANVAAIRKGTPAESKLERRGDRLVLPRRTKRLERAAGWRPSSLMRSPAGTPAGA
ncbi:MAG: hypothetical protein H0T75_06715 [Rhizobiales bacterium]|nr:hypothetical protein [Hyphomicrobiales bacterium]